MIKAPQDFWSGLIFAAAGLFVFWAGWNYPMGTASRMSYGYFPKLLAVALCVVGAIVILRSLVARGPAAPRLAWRPMLPLAAVVAFGVLLKPAGLIVATLALIVVGVMGSDRFRTLDVLGLALFLIPFNWLIFVWGLGLPLPVFPAW